MRGCLRTYRPMSQDLRVAHIMCHGQSLLADRAMGQPRPRDHVTPTGAITATPAQMLWPDGWSARLAGCMAATGCRNMSHGHKMWRNGL